MSAIKEAIKSTIQPVTKKPGHKTTEFWLTLGTNVAALLATISDVLPPKYGMVLIALSNGLYAVSRGIAKLTH